MRENIKNCTDFEVTPSSDVVFKKYGNNVLNKDFLIAFHLDGSILELLKGELHDKVNSLCIFELATESSLASFSKNLEELIKYIIYHNENIEIVNDKLWIVCANSNMYNKSIEIVKKCQKKITKNAGKIFPQPESSCFNSKLPGFNFCISVTLNQSYFAEIGEPDIKENITFFPKEKEEEIDFEDGWYYEEVWALPTTPGNKASDEMRPDGKVLTGWNKIDTIETHTISMRGMYSQNMGNISTSIINDNQTLTITRTVNSQIYGKTQE